jgi:hypothetical protein
MSVDQFSAVDRKLASYHTNPSCQNSSRTTCSAEETDTHYLVSQRGRIITLQVW